MTVRRFEVGDGRLFWLSDHALLVRRDGGRTWHRLDLRTGATAALTALTRRYRRTGSLLQPLSVSPDRAWLLWTDNDRTVHAATVDGARSFSVPVENTWDPVLWMPDSQALVTTDLSQTYGNAATLHPVRAPHAPRAFAFHAPVAWRLSNLDQTHLLAADRLWVCRWVDGESAPAGRLTLGWTSLRAVTPRARTTAMPLPPGVRRADACPSPDGARVVWLLRRRNRDEVWVSAIDGAGLRPVAGAVGPEIRWVDWRPDGRSVSVVRDGVLTLHPIPPS